MEASVVVCETLKPPRLCHTENQPEVRKTATEKRARGAMLGARGAFVSPIYVALPVVDQEPSPQVPLCMLFKDLVDRLLSVLKRTLRLHVLVLGPEVCLLAHRHDVVVPYPL